jgi:hypothetical protein
MNKINKRNNNGTLNCLHQIQKTHATLQSPAEATVEIPTTTYLRECKSLAHTLNKQAYHLPNITTAIKQR